MSDLVLWVEHPDFPSDATTSQDVGLLVVEGEGRPGQGVKVLFNVLVLVLHQYCPRVDIDDADAVAAAGRHVRCRLVVVLRVGFEHHLNNLWSRLGELSNMTKTKILPVNGYISN